MDGHRRTLADQAADVLRQPEEETWYPTGPGACFDVALHAGMCIRLIRVRRPGRRMGESHEIEERYCRDIRALRAGAVSDLVTKELVLKEPGPGWRRFRVHPDRIEELPVGETGGIQP